MPPSNPSPTMRAKMYVTGAVEGSKQDGKVTCETVYFACVSDKPFGPEGESEDNSFARYSPSGQLNITINNPNLVGAFHPGQKFYLDFTESPDSPAKPLPDTTADMFIHPAEAADKDTGNQN